MRRTAYGMTEGLDLDGLCDLDRYLKIEECWEAVAPAFTQLCGEVRRQGPRSRPVLHAIYFIRKHYSRDISIQDVARYANVNPNYLSGIFRENTGTALRDYITETRMEAARRLLRETDGRVADVARAVGFYDAKYFARTFKKLVGVSPAAYRAAK